MAPVEQVERLMERGFLLNHAGWAKKLAKIKQIEAIARGFNGLFDVDVW